MAPNVGLGRVGESWAQLGNGVLSRGLMMVELVPVRDVLGNVGLVGIIIIAWELNNSD